MNKDMYIRIKRQRSTLFLHVDPTDTLAQVLQQLSALLQQDAASLRVFKDSTALLDNTKTLADLSIGSNDVLGLVLKKSDGSWETLNVQEPDAAKDDS